VALFLKKNSTRRNNENVPSHLPYKKGRGAMEGDSLGPSSILISLSTLTCHVLLIANNSIEF
jgi:hypothetical protein